MADTAARRVEPTIPLTDPRFKYVNAASTDIRETFRKYDPHWPFGRVNPSEINELQRRLKQDDLSSLGEALL